MDENQFFKNATLRICGSLEIEKAIQRCLRYIRGFIPASKISFHTVDVHLGIVEAVSLVTPKKTEVLSIKTILTDEGRRGMYEKTQDLDAYKERPLGVALFKRMSDAIYLGPHFEKLGILELSGLLIELVLERESLGFLLINGEPGKVFTDNHIRLMSMLNEPFSIAISNSLRYRKLQEFKDRLIDEKKYLQDELLRISGKEIIGADHGLKRVMELVYQVAFLASPVLLMGETGTGKELIAGAIHHASSQKNGPFIKVNCGAIPISLMDTELFGHEKGAFTGAISKKRGLFERADRGTILLDEIGELSPEAQVRLLRVLQEKEIERVGGGTPIQLDIRVIVATHRNLEDMVAKGLFREDLYFRIKVFPIVIPPLRRRTGDIPALISHFIQKKSRELNLTESPSLTPGTIDLLKSYPWPGNVRELENAVERALIISNGEPLFFDNIGPSVRTAQNETLDRNETLDLDEAMAGHIRKVLDMCNGQVEGRDGAAQLLNINPSTLRKRMRKLGIQFGRNARKSRIPH
ncbi:MAG: AAA domain-containing protein [Deltaproteobacteria bacterium]|nr:AAA domain-containing protein [Deltaproteobacteria bacterium]